MSWLDTYFQWDTAIRSTVLFVVSGSPRSHTERESA